MIQRSSMAGLMAHARKDFCVHCLLKTGRVFEPLIGCSMEMIAAKARAVLLLDKQHGIDNTHACTVSVAFAAR